MSWHTLRGYCFPSVSPLHVHVFHCFTKTTDMAPLLPEQVVALRPLLWEDGFKGRLKQDSRWTTAWFQQTVFQLSCVLFWYPWERTQSIYIGLGKFLWTTPVCLETLFLDEVEMQTLFSTMFCGHCKAYVAPNMLLIAWTHASSHAGLCSHAGFINSSKS